jgi:hypothetical protein
MLPKKHPNIEPPLIGAHPYNAKVGGDEVLATIGRR